MRSKQNQKFLFLITFLFMTIYLLWRLFFTLPFQEGLFALIMGVLLLASEMSAAFGTFELFWRKNKESEIEKPLPLEEDFPHVDVFIATHNESADLLFNTINASTFMDYPDKSKVHIYVCDDGNRKEIAELAKSLNVNYLGLSENKDAKSGNLNHALSMSHSPLVVTFDSDMIPRHNFLMESVPYFLIPDYQKITRVFGKELVQKREMILKRLVLFKHLKAFITLIYFSLIYLLKPLFLMNKIFSLKKLMLCEIVLILQHTLVQTQCFLEER
ncbi:glycosyltransferase [Marinilactibacillus psychrotolerans]|uniref:Glycosyltransferase n=1 Tax=Marinilactibacillus psychrotolerans TaxID=191770 RepID=A0A5R9C847_9LACT|nr:glycosyltransferase [Marinilactibacillus psychrotolerans]